MAVPGYVTEVLAACQSVRLEKLRRSALPLPEPFNPIVICVLKDERDRLQDFLRHYREAGIERFVFIDNGSTDGTESYLARQPDADVYRKTGAFHWIAKQGWINRVVQMYGYDRWYIYVDADEHIVFEDIGARAFAELTRQMERAGTRRVRGLLVDMYGGFPLLEGPPLDGRRLAEICGYFDRTGYTEARFREIISVKGGPRVRAFGRADGKFSPEMTKYPLFRLSPGELMANPHHIWPYQGNFDCPRVLAILHFKFLSDTAERIRRAVERGNYWDRSFEYRCYAKVLRDDPRLSLLAAPSRRYDGPDTLLDCGLIVPSFPRRIPSDVGMAAAFRRRRAELRDTPPFAAAPPSAPLMPPPAPPPEAAWGETVAAQDDDFIGFLPEPGGFLSSTRAIC